MTDLETKQSLLREASARLLATVRDLPDEAYAAASALPGWTRAHVVAHLALNAEGLAGALDGVRRGEPVPMYASNEARDDDIAALAQASPAELRERLAAAVDAYDAALAALPDDRVSTRIERTPGGSTFSAAATPGMRLREVEIHHADLDAGYDRSGWPVAFVHLLIEGMTRRAGGSFRLKATDTGAEWTVGSGDGPLVSGTGADLGWWLTGRGGEDALTVTGGSLPSVEEW